MPVGKNAATAQVCGVAFDNTDFVDTDSERRKTPDTGPAPTREELDSRLTGAQQQLAKLRESHEQIEREIVAIEERRRKRAEFTQGLGEMRHELTRAVTVLEKSELDARRLAEQVARSLEGIRSAAAGIEPLSDESWTADTWEQELSRGLAIVENARMELNAARLKWPQLEGRLAEEEKGHASPVSRLVELPLTQLCRIGFALTWPLAAVALLAVAAAIAVLVRKV